tara:strand:- start:156 stop:2009 length:1854 start_codon:yes stop_codon:yes gene_type:complete
MKSFEADTGKVLNIVINSLYSDKEIFLRELISNSSDAIEKRNFVAISESNVEAAEKYKIDITLDKKNKTISIIDNGIGMNSDDLENSLGTIARSGTTEFLSKLNENNKKNKNNVNLIGQFGVGFYSAFMISDEVVVKSKKVGSDKSFEWKSDGLSGYEIAESEKNSFGTEIILKVKNDSKEFLDENKLTSITKKYSDHIPYQIEFFLSNKKEGTILNLASAIWTRNRKDITEEQYNEFYHHIGGGYDKPILTIHNKSEGTVSYTNLLFIPERRPFDLFNAERTSKLKLYVNRVFITDNCDDILPKWLRFIYGIIDTPDLDLNVSREMLQHNPSLKRISKALVKKVLNELEKLKDNDFDKFKLFWNEFGPAFKEGIYESPEHKERLLNLSLFISSKSNDHISLKDYLENMHPKQNEIYYITADNVDRAKNSPHLEALKDKGIEVFFFVDPIDTFWLQNQDNFKDKKFISITKGKIDLDVFDEKKDKKENQEEKNNFDDLIKLFKEKLGERVSDVRISNKLVGSPSCLVADDTGMDIQMERIMKMHDKDFSGMPRILELNENHELLNNLNNIIDKNVKFVEDASLMLFDQAKILEGQLPSDLSEFSSRLTNFINKSIPN